MEENDFMKNNFNKSYLAFFLKSLLQPRDFEKAVLILETEIRRFSEKLLKSSETSKSEAELKKKLEIYKTMFHELAVEFDEYEMESVATKKALKSKMKRAQKRVTYLEKKLEESEKKHSEELTTVIRNDNEELGKGETEEANGCVQIRMDNTNFESEKGRLEDQTGGNQNKNGVDMESECLKPEREMELEVCRAKCQELSMELEEKKMKCVAFADKLEATLLRKSAADDKLKEYLTLCDGLKERISSLEGNLESMCERENAAQERITILSEKMKNITRDGSKKHAHLKENDMDSEPAEGDIEVGCPGLETRESRFPCKLQLVQMKSLYRPLIRCDKSAFSPYVSSIHQSSAKEKNNVCVSNPPSVDIQGKTLVKAEEVSKMIPSESKVEHNEAAIIEVSDDSSIICWDNNRDDSNQVDEGYESSCDDDCPCSSKHKRKRGSEIVASENESESQSQDELKLKKLRELKYDVPKSSPENGKIDVIQEDYLIPGGERLGGSIVEESYSSDTSSKSQDAENNCLDFSQAMQMGFKCKDEQKTNWKVEADMVSSFEEDPKLCLQAVCALYRQLTSNGEFLEDSLDNCYLGFNKIDTLRGTALAEFLTDGDQEGNVTKTIEELELFDPEAFEDCKRIARKYSSKLFTIYQTKENRFFCPS